MGPSALARRAGRGHTGTVRAIVLVKQVPDLRVGSVGVHPDGTIDRAAAPPITNPADLHAVEAAVQVADEVVAISMGPPQAEGALRDAIAGGARRGVLLCDRLLAGSDTWATANALVAGILAVGGADIVVCGMTALDGETGQVGPSVAARLDWPQVTGCESMTIEGSTIVARRVVEGGYEVVRATLPAVVTISETGFPPRYPSLPARKRAQGAEIETLDAAALGLDSSDVGLAASPTKVAHMAPAPLPDRGCRFVGDGFDYDALVSALEARGALAPGARAADETAPGSVAQTAGSTGEWHGPTALWVVCTEDEGGLDHASRELLTKAVELAPSLGGGVGALILTGNPDGGEQMVADAARHGADVAYVAAHAALAGYRTLPWARTVAKAIRTHGPRAVLLAATTTGRDLAPRVASMLSTGLAADCTDLYVADWSRRDATYAHLLHMVRPAMAGGVLATCLCPQALPQMATVRPGVFAVTAAPRSPVQVVVPFTPDPGDDRVVVLERHVSGADVDLRAADVVIAGGAGCDAAGWHLVEDLAAAIGGRVAASRGAVEAGRSTRAQQVGQTGATVRPSLYVACGISGALQHAVGMQDSGTIVAINRDPDAVIFRLAHFGIVGDVHDVLPALTAALRTRRPASP